MSKDFLSAAVIGTGKIAQTRHIPEYAADPRVRLAGYFNGTTSRAEKMAEHYGGKVYSSIEQLLADPEIDIVSVCLANSAHAQISIDALEAGKDVLCEKPMAVDLKESTRMIASAEQNGRRLLIAQNQRLDAAHLMAKKLIEEKKIGDVLTFKSSFSHSGPENWSIQGGPDTWFFDKKRSSFGAIFDLGIHKIDLIQYLLSSPAVKVEAKTATLDKRDSRGKLIDVDDNAFAILQLANGTIGSINVSWTNYGPIDNATTIYGDRGVLKIYDDPAYPIELFSADGSKDLYSQEDLQKVFSIKDSGVINEFVDAVIKKRPSILDAEKILPSMQTVFAAIESSKTGKEAVIGS
ncbi:Gfo/Idh/MocA family protein [Oenococcus alcoholitolerans]|uniref:Gfo/Idh/MocA family protein n=1 Tax=Oenococcus alcoholitolerans TaxID=931074 RepID=UPI003F6FC5B2